MGDGFRGLDCREVDMCVRGRVMGIWSCDHYSAWEHWKWLFFNLVPAAVSSELKARRTEVRHTAGSV